MIFEYAGYVGVEPWRFTLRQLDDMYWGRAFRQWDHTANLIAAVMNSQAGKDSQLIEYDQVHPYIQRQVTRGNMLPLTLANLERAFGNHNHTAGKPSS